MNKNKTKLILFDFDGTIADSYLEVLASFNEVGPFFNLQKIPVEKAEKLRDFSFQDILEKVNVSRWKLPFVIILSKRKLNGQISKIKPFNQMIDLIKKLRERDWVMGILTSNSKKNVEDFLRYNNLDYFDFIIASSMLGKANKMRKVIKKYNYSPQNIISIGDEIRDIEAARKVGITPIAVTWGFNSKKALAAYQPDYLVDTPQELLNILTR